MSASSSDLEAKGQWICVRSSMHAYSSRKKDVVRVLNICNLKVALDRNYVPYAEICILMSNQRTDVSYGGYPSSADVRFKRSRHRGLLPTAVLISRIRLRTWNGVLGPSFVGAKGLCTFPVRCR